MKRHGRGRAAQRPLAEATVHTLVRELAEATGHDAAYYAARSNGFTAEASWPTAAEPRIVAGPTRLHGVVEPVPGGGALVLDTKRVGDADVSILRRTACLVAVSVAGQRLRAEQARVDGRARALTEDLQVARDRLVHVRDLERRRLVGALTAVTTRDFAELRRRLRELDEAVATDGEVEQFMARFRGALDDVIARFRTVVRGVHPAMLPDVGPRAALEELAADLPRPVRFIGDLGRRAGWEVESGVYHAGAAVLALFAECDATEPVTVAFARRDDRLWVTVTDPASAFSSAELRAALSDDTDRLAAFGGHLDTAVGEICATVKIWLPERFDGRRMSKVEGRAHETSGTLLDAVRQLVAAASSTPEWAEVAAGLDRPPTVAVVGATGTAAVIEALTGIDFAGADTVTWYVHGRARDVTAYRPGVPPRTVPVVVAGLRCPPDTERLVVRWPADLLQNLTLVDVPFGADPATFAAEPGTRGWGVDVVLYLRSDDTAADQEFLRALRASPRRVDAIAIDGSNRDLVEILRRRVIARADLIVARTALSAARRLLAAAPPTDPVARLLDRIHAEAHELTELDLLADLNSDAVVLRADRSIAERLLGADGRDARPRLGLPDSATSEEVRKAARQAAVHWRRSAEHPATGNRAREACHVLIRTCEGIASA